MTSPKLFIGNVAWKTTEAALQDLFSQYGTVVSCKIIIDKFTGRSRGIAFVEMSSLEEAEAAIAGLNNKEVDGRQIAVNEARPMEERPPRRDFGGPRRGGFGGGSSGPRPSYDDQE